MFSIKAFVSGVFLDPGEITAQRTPLRYKISEIPAQWEERSEGSSRFKIFKWLPGYLKWYFYGLGTTWLKKGPQDVKKKI